MFDVNCGICKKFITRESQEESTDSCIISTAKMIDSHRFWIGISGVYYIDDDSLSLKEGDHICNDCIQKNIDKIKPDESVSCPRCGKCYQPCWYEDDDSIAACWGMNVYPIESKEKLVGDWGSNWDTFYFKIEDPQVLSFEKICDSCVDDLLDKKAIVKEESYMDAR